MRRGVALFALLIALGLVAAGTAGAAAPEWHSEQPVAAGIGVPVPFGEVGDLECRQANRCVLITAGSGGHTVGAGMPAGIYAYDGVGWHLYSTVCGGHNGRIAWAGPDEFWTISDQVTGEEPAGSVGAFWNLSLCHFKGGEVVASYAEPLGRADSYTQMTAAACEGPDDCWFAGKRLTDAANVGAFHLHWDGLGVAPVPSLTVPEPGLLDPGRSVFDLAFHEGRLYESVSVAEGDEPIGEAEPSFIHRISPGALRPFEPLTVPGLELGGNPENSEGFRFASVGPELWAISGAGEFKFNTVALLRLVGESFVQVPLSGGVFKPGDVVSGLAAEPAAGDAWASFEKEGRGANRLARLAQVHADGSVDDEVVLPRPEEELNPKGSAGPIVCPAAEQCWMVTSQGWLFHLGGPPAEGPDTDPAMHRLITSRPCDDACRSGTAVGLPVDNSGAEPEAPLFAAAPPYEPLPTRPRKPHPLYTHLRQKVIDHTILQLTFVLHARAHVQLIAKEQQRIVAKTARLTLAQGKHRIRLTLDPKHWPTHLSFQVHPVKKKGA